MAQISDVTAPVRLKSHPLLPPGCIWMQRLTISACLAARPSESTQQGPGPEEEQLTVRREANLRDTSRSPCAQPPGPWRQGPTHPFGSGGCDQATCPPVFKSLGGVKCDMGCGPRRENGYQVCKNSITLSNNKVSCTTRITFLVPGLPHSTVGPVDAAPCHLRGLGHPLGCLKNTDAKGHASCPSGQTPCDHLLPVLWLSPVSPASLGRWPSQQLAAQHERLSAGSTCWDWEGGAWRTVTPGRGGAGTGCSLLK